MENRNSENLGSRDRGNQNGDRQFNPSQQRKRPFYFRKKVCKICHKDLPSIDIDYKNVGLLKRFITEKGKIVPRRLTGVCAKHQRTLTKAIKQARTVALLPFTQL